MLLQELCCNLRNLAPCKSNAGVSNHNVEMVDTLGLEVFYGTQCVGDRRGFDLDEDELAARSLGQRKECFGAGA